MAEHLKVLGHVGFFFRPSCAGRLRQPCTNPLDKPDATVARQIAQAASAFEQQPTGHVPQSGAVVLSEETLVLTLHGALAPAETALAPSLGEWFSKRTIKE